MTTPNHHQTQFGALLSESMQRRGITKRKLERQLKVTRTTINFWLLGSVMPSPDNASLLSLLCDEPKLLSLTVKARTRMCLNPYCKKTFVASNLRRSYCSYDCARLSRKIGKKKKPDAQVNSMQAAINAFCRDCVDDGVCRTPACPLRPFTPMIKGGLIIAERHNTAQKTDEARASASARSKAYFAIPANKEKHAQLTKDGLHSLSAEQKGASKPS